MRGCVRRAPPRRAPAPAAAALRRPPLFTVYGHGSARRRRPPPPLIGWGRGAPGASRLTLCAPPPITLWRGPELPRSAGPAAVSPDPRGAAPAPPAPGRRILPPPLTASRGARCGAERRQSWGRGRRAGLAGGGSALSELPVFSLVIYIS